MFVHIEVKRGIRDNRRQDVRIQTKYKVRKGRSFGLYSCIPDNMAGLSLIRHVVDAILSVEIPNINGNIAVSRKGLVKTPGDY